MKPVEACAEGGYLEPFVLLEPPAHCFLDPPDLSSWIPLDRLDPPLDSLDAPAPCAWTALKLVLLNVLGPVPVFYA